MLEFKSTEDLAKLSPDDPAFPIVEDLVKRLITDYIAEGYDYRPEDDGYTILVEPEDADRELEELWPGCRLTNILWEGITLRDGPFLSTLPSSFPKSTDLYASATLRRITRVWLSDEARGSDSGDAT